MAKARLSGDAKALLRAMRKEWARAREETVAANNHMLQLLDQQATYLSRASKALDVIADGSAAATGWKTLLEGRRVRQAALEEERRAAEAKVAPPPPDASQGPSRDSGGIP